MKSSFSDGIILLLILCRQEIILNGFIKVSVIKSANWSDYLRCNKCFKIALKWAIDMFITACKDLLHRINSFQIIKTSFHLGKSPFSYSYNFFCVIRSPLHIRNTPSPSFYLVEDSLSSHKEVSLEWEDSFLFLKKNIAIFGNSQSEKPKRRTNRPGRPSTHTTARCNSWCNQPSDYRLWTLGGLHPVQPDNWLCLGVRTFLLRNLKCTVFETCNAGIISRKYVQIIYLPLYLILWICESLICIFFTG